MNRKTQLLGGFGFLTLSTVAFTQSEASIAAMVAARAAQGLASAIIQTGAIGLVSDMFAGTMDGGGDFEHAFANVVTANMFGAALGPVVGAILYTLQGFNFTFMALGVFAGLIFVVVALNLRASDTPQPPIRFSEHTTDPWVIAIVAGLGVAGWAMSMLEPTLPVHLQAAFGTREAVIGLAFTELILSQQVFMPIIFQVIEGKAEDRPVYIVSAYVTIAIFLLLTFLVQSIWLCFVLLFLFGLAVAVAVAACNAELSEALGSEQIRSTQNLANYFLKETGYRVGTCFGPLVGAAFVGDSLGPFFLTAAGCIGFLPVFFILREKSGQRKM